MMYVAKTLPGQIVRAETPASKAAAVQARPSVFSSDSGMMLVAKTLPGQIVRAEAPVPQTAAVQRRPSVFSSDSGMMFVAKTVPGQIVKPEAPAPKPAVQKRPSVFSNDGGGMMFAAKTVQSEAPLPPRPISYLKGAFSSEDAGMMYQVKTVQAQPPTPKRVVPYRGGVFSNVGMMYEAKTAQGNMVKPEPPVPKPLVPYRRSVFSSDTGMMFVAKTAPGQIVKPEVPAPKPAVQRRPSVFSNDGGGMMFAAKTVQSEAPLPPRPVPYREGVFSNVGMMYEEGSSSSGRKFLSPNAVETSETTGQSFAAFASDGGIQLQAQMAQKPVALNPSPAVMVETAIPNDGLSFRLDEEPEGKRLYLNPDIAEASETSGQSFASFGSDGGIQLMTRMAAKPVVKSAVPMALAAPLPAGYDNMSFSFDKAQSKRRRFFIPPKVAKASETVGQSFAKFSSDGGIQLVTQTLASSAGGMITSPTSSSQLIQILGGRATADFNSDGLQYIQRKFPEHKRVFLNPKVADEIETIGQSFAILQDDGGIGMQTKTAPSYLSYK